MDKLKMQSKNKIDENIERIGAMFPNCLTEVIGADGGVQTAIDFEMLKQELSSVVVEGEEERYQFTWPDKKKSILLANSPINKTLRPCREESVDFDSTQNLYIEGDNLDVLKLLQETYMGKVKMIYIDPPYNTGKDFVYKDNRYMSMEEYMEISNQTDEDGNRLFQNNESNGRFHTDWLNMIFPRLKVAKDLLTDDGVIFISIDDYEVENLKKVCNEIFGESNFVGQWNWFKSATPPNLSYKIKKNLEYIIVYEKVKDNTRYCGLTKISASNDPFTKPQNKLKFLTFKAGTISTKMADGTYPKGIYGTKKFPNEMINDLIIENGVNVNDVTFYNRFIWVQTTLDTAIVDGLTIELSKQFVLSYKRANYSPECPPNLIDESVDVDTTEQAGIDLQLLMDHDKLFDYPKSVSLLKYLLTFKDDKNATILDFFSGSATTAHAVMRLNAEDGGNRKFICVQLPEEADEESEAFKAGYKNICEIGKERIRRAGARFYANTVRAGDAIIDVFTQKKENPGQDVYISQGYPIDSQERKDKNKELADSLDIGFRVLKLDSSNMKDVYYRPDQLSQDMFQEIEGNIKPDRTPEDLLFQVMLDMGVMLDSKIAVKEIQNTKIFVVGEQAENIQPNLVCCFDENLTNEVVTAIAKLNPLYAIFRDSSLASDSTATNFDQIFQTYSKDTVRKVI